MPFLHRWFSASCRLRFWLLGPTLRPPTLAFGSDAYERIFTRLGVEYVIVKADAGTYGMGIMTVRDVKDLGEINRKTRNKMSVIKDGQSLNQVIIQEGVITHERLNDAVAEPVVYMMDRYVVGGFYRIHAERGIDENLNAPGSSFVPLAFEQSAHTPQPGVKPGASSPNRFYMYGVIGRLAMLAASYELEATDPEAENYD